MHFADHKMFISDKIINIFSHYPRWIFLHYPRWRRGKDCLCCIFANWLKDRCEWGLGYLSQGWWILTMLIMIIMIMPMDVSVSIIYDDKIQILNAEIYISVQNEYESKTHVWHHWLGDQKGAYVIFLLRAICYVRANKWSMKHAEVQTF